MTLDVPTFVRIEYWSHAHHDWTVGHAGLNLMNPARYVQKLAERGTIARAVELDDENQPGEIVYGPGGDLL